MKLPYNLEPHQLVLESSAHDALQRETETMTSIMEELIHDWSDEEIERVGWAVGALCASPACQQWLNAIEGRQMSDWVQMAFHTAMIWERG